MNMEMGALGGDGQMYADDSKIPLLINQSRINTTLNSKFYNIYLKFIKFPSPLAYDVGCL